jgi:hypothetical protein
MRSQKLSMPWEADNFKCIELFFLSLHAIKGQENPVYCVEGAKYKVCGEGCQWQCTLEETRRKEEKTRSFAKSASQEVFVPISS